MVTAILILTALVFPLVLVTQTHNFWVDTATYFEQPSIKHLNELLVFVYTDRQVYAIASTQSLNDLIENSNEKSSKLAPSFKFLNNDINSDGKVDSIDVQVSFNSNGEAIRNIIVMQSVVYSIKDKINANILVRLLNQFDTPNGLSKLTAQGTLVLNQK